MKTQQTEEPFTHDFLRSAAAAAMRTVLSSMPHPQEHAWEMSSTAEVNHGTLSSVRNETGGFLVRGEFIFFPSTGRAMVPPADSQTWASATSEWADTDGRIYSARPTDCYEVTWIRVITVDQDLQQGVA